MVGLNDESLVKKRSCGVVNIDFDAYLQWWEHDLCNFDISNTWKCMLVPVGLASRPGGMRGAFE